MRRGVRSIRWIPMAAGMTAIALLAVAPAGAHCDTLDGPVVLAAKAALDKGDVTPVLKWVREDGESEIREAFAKALAVRSVGPEAKDLADTWFLETLVRVHRAGEGAPFTGLKPAKSEADPAVREADAALVRGSVDGLVSLVTKEAASGIREKFQEAAETKKHSEESVKAGRKFVAAYVEYVHYVERLYQDVVAPPDEHAGVATSPGHHGHDE
jgi:hypothetical protein